MESNQGGQPSLINDVVALLRRSEGEPTIFRVPQAPAEAFEACRPRVVSIGPYHHGEPQLQKFQSYKRSYLLAMERRTDVYLEHLIPVVSQKVEMIRQCYSESTNHISRIQLVTMMVLDGCFIIEFLREQKRAFQARLIKYPFMVNSIRRDLLRLENQVPYFLLKGLFEMTEVPPGNVSLVDLALHSFADIGERHGCIRERDISEPVHLLGLFRLALIPLIPSEQQQNPVDEDSSLYMIRSASELCRMGIRFKKSEASTFLDIKFDKRRGIIEIPNVTINDKLKCILTDMVTLEQCLGQEDRHITCYALFMGLLLPTTYDVQLLRDCKAISIFGMSNDDFVHFFGDNCKDVIIDLEKTYLFSHITNINKALKRPGAYRGWALLENARALLENARAQLVNTLLENPWKALSGLAVLVTLASVIQTIYSVLQYYYRK